MMTLEQATNRLTGVMWWLKGFLGACTTDREDAAFSLERHISDVREMLAKLQDGMTRTLIPARSISYDGRGNRAVLERDDGGLVIITYGELERLVDGILRTPSLEDRLYARETVQRVVDEFRAEQDALEAEADAEVPF